MPSTKNSLMICIQKLVFSFMLVCCLSCSHYVVDGADSKAHYQLKFLGDLNFSSDLKFQDTLVGGISGIIYDQEEQAYWMVSDDRGQNGPVRVYLANLDWEKKHWNILKQIELKDQGGASFVAGMTDFEGITILPNKNLLISSEGNYQNFAQMPALYEFKKDGTFVKKWVVSQKFYFGKEFGTKDNAGFEPLNYIAPFVYTANEMPLYQDDQNVVRIVRYHESVPCTEFAYRLSTTENGNGVVEFLGMSENRLLAMERSFDMQNKKNRIKIFEVNLDEATNIYQIPRVTHEVKIQEVQKGLVIDLDDIIEQLDPAFKRLDNLEAMSFGPKLPNGHQTLILASDNNFGQKQRTLFLKFEIIPLNI